MKQLTVLSRSYCHLCDDMVAALQQVRARFANGFAIEVVDIDQHPEMEAIWGNKVPVLLDGDEEICCFFLDQDRLTLHLAASGRRP